MSIGVINYGSGNYTSLCNALAHLGFPIFEIAEPSGIERASHLILPGVGSFRAAMEKLDKRGLVEPLRAQLHRGDKPFLGICVGMQILATEGIEFGPHEGLDVIGGTVAQIATGAEPVRLPHIGWNDVEATPGCPLFEGIDEPPVFYFVHTYAFDPIEANCVVARCTYGQPFAAAVQDGLTFGVQFHPEKSQAHGLRLLHNFCTLGATGAC